MMHFEPDENEIVTADSANDLALNVPLSAGVKPIAESNFSSSSLKLPCSANSAAANGKENEQIGEARSKDKKWMAVPETSEIYPCILRLMESIGPENSNRTTLRALLQFAKTSNDLSAEEAMFIHLVRAWGVEYAIGHILSPLVGIRRVLRVAANSIPSA